MAQIMFCAYKHDLEDMKTHLAYTEFVMDIYCMGQRCYQIAFNHPQIINFTFPLDGI